MLHTLQPCRTASSTGRTCRQPFTASGCATMARVSRRSMVCSATEVCGLGAPMVKSWQPSQSTASRSSNCTTQEGQASQASGNVCKTCGIDLGKAPGGCDQEGRIVGGLGSVPGFGWWPIKAYRPCPGLDQAGMEYVRKGQATNEMLFGGVSLGQSQQQSLKRMTDTAEKGIDVDV